VNVHAVGLLGYLRRFMARSITERRYTAAPPGWRFNQTHWLSYRITGRSLAGSPFRVSRTFGRPPLPFTVTAES
jgi:hypothetical protein